MARQNALTLVTPVAAGKYDELNSKLMQMRADLSAGNFKEFEKIDTLHYARYVLLDEKHKFSNSKTQLVFSSDYDGDEDVHLTLIATKCGDHIDQLYSLCEGYPATNDRTPATRENYLKKWSRKNTAFYIGAPGRTLKQIRQESRLRDYIWDFLNKGKWEGKTAKEVHGVVKQHVFEQPEFAWAREQIHLPKVKWWNFALLGAVAVLLIWMLKWWFLLIPAVLAAWLIVLHFFFEKKDKPLGLVPSQLDPGFITEMEGYEDFQNQNQFSQVIPMKAGWFRLMTIRLVLLYGKFRIKNEFQLGELMGIPTIHFARWVMLDNNKQVLFLSNFDGSWQQYLGDFIDKSGWGLTGIFSNTENFPTCRYLFWGGAYDEEHFLAWSRYYQVPSQVWYCAYPHLSIKNVNTNSVIRHELTKNLNEEQAKTFLNRF
jgi:hypothetical protein